MAYGGRRQGGRGRLVLTVVLYVSLVVVVALGVPLGMLWKFFADQGSCRGNLAAIHAATKTLNSSVSYVFVEAPSSRYGRTQAERSLLMLFRPFGKPAFVADTEALLCPASDAPKTAVTRTQLQQEDNFPKPRENCFYSFRNVGKYWPPDAEGDHPDPIAMADRSPFDDGHPLSGNSANHRWGDANVGQNVCYTSGVVRWADSPNFGAGGENIYAVGNDPTIRVTANALPVDEADTILMPVSLVQDQRTSP